MRAEKRARFPLGVFDTSRAAECKDPFRGALRLERAARKGRSVLGEQCERANRIPVPDRKIGFAQ